MTTATLHPALAVCDIYMREWLPARLAPSDVALLREVGLPVRMEIHTEKGGERLAWTLLADDTGLHVVDDDPVCGFSMDVATFQALASARLSPQRAFYMLRVKIGGSKLTALKLGGILESIFRRIPATWPLTPTPGAESDSVADTDTSDEVPAVATSPKASAVAPSAPPLTPYQRSIIALHCDPHDGAPYWIERSRELGVAFRALRTFEDLARFGPMDRLAQESRPWRDFVPQRVLRDTRGLILGETGGTTGAPITAAWTPDDFHAAFVAPLAAELVRRRIDGLRQWLFVGPSGPHIIGKAARALARHTTGCDPLEIDFDPRWHRRMQPGGTASRRHLRHLVEQTLALLRRERPDVVFVTPSVLAMLLDEPERPWIDAWRVVHLGGQSISLAERAALAARLPKGCELINGYGNSLCGCLLEDDPSRPLTYPARQGERLRVELVNNDDPRQRILAGAVGTVLVHRFDRSRLLLNQLERDTATLEADGRLAQPAPRAEVASPDGNPPPRGIY